MCVPKYTLYTGYYQFKLALNSVCYMQYLKNKFIFIDKNTSKKHV